MNAKPPLNDFFYPDALWATVRYYVPKPRIAIELGPGAGRSTVQYLDNLPSIRWLITVDHRVRGDTARAYLSRRRSFWRRVIDIAAHTDEAHVMVADGCADVLFIDAFHEYPQALRDLRNWVPKVRPDGLVVQHDYQEHGVMQALDEFRDVGGYEVGPLEPSDKARTAWFVKK